jgi:hypothetical protein
VAGLVKRLREFLAVRLAANFTTTVVAATSTALTFNIGPNEVWSVDVQITAQCSGNGGSKYAVAAPAGATIEGWIYSSTNAVTTLSYQRLTAVGALNATPLHTVTTTPAPDVIRFVITNGSTAGTVAIQAASVTAGQTTTLFLGSGLVAVRIA